MCGVRMRNSRHVEEERHGLCYESQIEQRGEAMKQPFPCTGAVQGKLLLIWSGTVSSHMGQSGDRAARETMDDGMEIKIVSDEETEKMVEGEQPAESTDAPTLETADEFRDRWLRTAAELDNMHKRMARRIDQVAQEERRAVLSAFLAVVDSLERALAMDDAPAGSWAEGVAGIHRQMLSILKRFGAEPMDALGTPFDPNRHEAMAVIMDSDHPENTVIEVTEVGYELNDGTLLRPAKVVVAGRGGSRTE